MKEPHSMAPAHHQEMRLTEYLSKLVSQESELLGVAITDRDGIPIVQEWSRAGIDLAANFSSSSQITAAFSTMSDQANKLGLGDSDMFIASYQHYQIIQFNELSQNHCVVTLFTTANANIGVLVEKRQLWRGVAAQISKDVIRSPTHTDMI